jgi:hypothetical protein
VRHSRLITLNASLLPSGENDAGPALGDLQRLLEARATGRVDEEEAADALAVRRAVGAHEDAAAVGGPVERQVVVAAARRHRADVGIPGQPAGLAALERHELDLPRPEAFARVRDVLAVRRDAAEHLEALVVARQAPRADAVALDPACPEVAAVAEHEFVAAHVGEAQQASFVGGRFLGPDWLRAGTLRQTRGR